MPPGNLMGAHALPLLRGSVPLAADSCGPLRTPGLPVLLSATTLAQSHRGNDTGMLHQRGAWGPVELQGQPRIVSGTAMSCMIDRSQLLHHASFF